MTGSNEYKRRALYTLIKAIPYSEVSLKFAPRGSQVTTYENISSGAFIDYARDIFDGYSLNEIENCYTSIVKPESVFSLISAVASDYLQVENTKERGLSYRPEKTMGWRYISSKIGDDLLASAFLINEINLKDTTWKSFIQSGAYDPAKEYAENHFHLKASCRTLELNWVALMNNPLSSRESFRELERSLARERVTTTGEKSIDSLYSRCMKAAAYRAYLFARLKGGFNYVTGRLKEEILRVENKECDSGFSGRVNNLIFSLSKRNRSDKAYTQLDYVDLTWNINDEIFPIYNYHDSPTGYSKHPATKDPREDCRAFLGERLLLMACFQAIKLNDARFTFLEKSVFYRYLIIRHDFREELIQGNQIIGLQNFKMFQDRKGEFSKLNKNIYQRRELPKMAIHETLSRNVSSLEARIMPNLNPVELKKTMRDYLETAESTREQLTPLNKQMFFVTHVDKRKDKNKNPGTYRHQNYRRLLRRVSDSLKSVLNDTDINYYLRGIDTCSEEIGCRPEVYGPFYRELLAYRFPEKFGSTIRNHFIMATYHVGEDFLDLVDGLRSIDEVLLFCGYKPGCRLGHALALGTDPHKYYQKKRNTVCLPKQDHLDNLVWMFATSKKLHLEHIVGIEILEEIENESVKLAAEIGYGEIDILNYYYAWMLRGDSPEVYKEIHKRNGWYKYYRGLDYSINDAEEIALLRTSIRDDAEVLKIIHDYHYKHSVYIEGSKYEVYEISPKKIHLIKLLQNHIIDKVERRDIFVEANPSSNYEIGPFDRYDEHPIIRLNTEHLITGASGGRINVSINTDDIGVFDTSLENEYMIMQSAMEKSAQSDGTPLYHDVEKWIEGIRENGLKQAFKYEEMKDI